MEKADSQTKVQEKLFVSLGDGKKIFLGEQIAEGPFIFNSDFEYVVLPTNTYFDVLMHM